MEVFELFIRKALDSPGSGCMIRTLSTTQRLLRLLFNKVEEERNAIAFRIIEFY